MGWEWGYTVACGVWSGQVRSAHGAFVCLGKGVPWTIGGIEDFPIIVMTDQRKRFV